MKKDLQVVTKEFAERLPLSVKASFVDLAKKEIQSVSLNKGMASISSSDSDKLSADLVNHVVSEEFLEKLVDDVGEPKQNETKEEYLARAKADFMKLLDGTTTVSAVKASVGFGVGSFLARKLWSK